MVEFCCRVNVCFHILISGLKRGGAGGGGCWCTLTAKIIMSWAIKTQKILVDYWHKSSEFLPGDKLQTVFFFCFFFSLFFPLACVTRRCWRDLKDWYFGRPITDDWVPSRQAALNKKKNTPTLPHTSAIGHQKQRRHLCRAVHMRSRNVGECDSDIGKKKKKASEKRVAAGWMR